MRFSRLIAFLLFVFTVQYSSAQDTIFFAPEGFPVFTWLDSETYSVFTDVDTADLLLETAYYLDRNLKGRCTYINYKKDIKHGKCSEYREGGKIWYSAEYKDGMRHGNIISFHENGQMKRQDFYRNDTLVSGWNYDEAGKRVKSYPFEVRPEPQKGRMAFLEELNKKVKLSDEGIQVEIEFWITRDGNLRAVEAQSEEPKAAQAIESAFGELRSWKSGLRDGEKAVFREFLTVYVDSKALEEE
jgi:hypothetical protein